MPFCSGVGLGRARTGLRMATGFRRFGGFTEGLLEF